MYVNPYYESSQNTIDTCLEHYGVKGMKWGVRRYEDYDGKRTNKVKQQYADARQAYNTARKSKNKASRVVAKSNLKSAKKKLKTAYLTDEGERLSKSGKSIYMESTKNAIRQMTLSYASNRAISDIWRRNSTTNVGYLSAKTIELGSKAISAAMWGKTYSDVKKLDAYEKYGDKRKW